VESDGPGQGFPRTVSTREGGQVLIRPIGPEDREALRAAFDRLSPESRYRRFLSPVDRLTENQLDYLTEIDHRDHEALVAVDPEGEGVGVARFVRLAAEPESAEVAVAVVDDWQGRGVGTALLTALTERERAESVRRFTATVLAENRDVVELLRDVGAVRSRPDGAGTLEMAVELAGASAPASVELEFEVPRAGGVGAALGRTLRAAAAGQLRLPGWEWIEESARSLRRRLR
jgi:GNAT superfamily N-acetyltransferase